MRPSLTGPSPPPGTRRDGTRGPGQRQRTGDGAALLPGPGPLTGGATDAARRKAATACRLLLLVPLSLAAVCRYQRILVMQE